LEKHFLEALSKPPRAVAKGPPETASEISPALPQIAFYNELKILGSGVHQESVEGSEFRAPKSESFRG
jgi:hypothetical protein